MLLVSDMLRAALDALLRRYDLELVLQQAAEFLTNHGLLNTAGEATFRLRR